MPDEEIKKEEQGEKCDPWDDLFEQFQMQREVDASEDVLDLTDPNVAKMALVMKRYASQFALDLKKIQKLSGLETRYYVMAALESLEKLNMVNIRRLGRKKLIKVHAINLNLYDEYIKYIKLGLKG